MNPRHRHGSPNNSPLKNLALVIGSIFGLCMLMCVGGMVWLMTGDEGGTRMANEMETYAVEYIEQHNLLKPGEEIVAYYDVTIRLSGTEAYLLTDQRLIHHQPGIDHIVYLTEIDEVHVNRDEIGSTIIEIFTDDDRHMKLEIAVLNGGEAFGRALNRHHERPRAL